MVFKLKLKFIDDFSEQSGIGFLGAVSLGLQSDISYFKEWLGLISMLI